MNDQTIGGIDVMDSFQSRRMLDEMHEPLTSTAIQIGEERLCRDMEYLSSFINECEGGERENSWFGPISTHELISSVMFHPSADDRQLAEAAREFRRRYLAAHPEYIREAAERAMR